MKRFAYYPGCSLSSSAKEYDKSCRAVCEALGIELAELENWNCCGASSAHSLDAGVDLALSARNIALAHKMGLAMVVPCAACYARTAHAWNVLNENPEERAKLEKEFDFTFRPDLPVNHILQAIDEAVASRQPLVNESSSGNTVSVGKAVCYYGCLINRPRGINPSDDMENPRAMERILNHFGYKTAEWSYATECCGAALALTRTDIVATLVQRIVDAAEQSGADAIVTGCPMCQVNLESRQSGDFRVFYFTELVGLALGIEEASQWFKMHLIDPRTARKAH